MKLVQDSKKSFVSSKQEENGEGSGKLSIVEQEIKMARQLASNDPKDRSKVLKNLKKWLKLRSQGSFQFTDSDFLRLWKGLWYCMYMSDKPLTQEKLAEDLASLVHCFEEVSISVQFFKTFMLTASREWFGIDQWRIDKYMMLVRRMTRQIFFKLSSENDWDLSHIRMFGKCLEGSIYDETKAPIGLIMHFNDIYLEELSKAADGDITDEKVHAMLEPCVLFFAKARDLRLIKHTKRNIFYKLLFQSALGQEYQEKFEIWKRTNFPTSSLDDLEVNMEVEEAEEDDEEGSDGEPESEEKSLDIRAGRVNVELHELPFDPKQVMELFEKYRFKPFTNAKGRRQIKEILKVYRTYATGEFPLGTKKIQTAKDVMSQFEPLDPEKKAAEMLEFEEEIVKNSVYLPDRVKRKLEWKRKKQLELLNGSKKEKETSEVENGIKNGQKRKLKSKNGATEVKKRKGESENNSKSPIVNGGKDLSVGTGKTKLSKRRSLPVVGTSTFLEEDNEIEVPMALEGKKSRTSLKGNAKKMVINPLAVQNKETPIKKVQIVLQKNTEQDTEEYIETVKNSPQVPWDSNKKPKKGLLKPGLVPSPISPWFKKKIGIDFNETL